MKIFWRTSPLAPFERDLLDQVLEAHRRSALRANASTVVLQNAFAASGSFTQAVSAALNTLGWPHGCVREAYRHLAGDLILPPMFLNEKIPGWGNAFHKGCPDPLWTEVDRTLEMFDIARRLEAITAALHQRGKRVFPNPAGYTAAAAIALGIPEALSPALFVAGRLDGWAELLAQSTITSPTTN